MFKEFAENYHKAQQRTSVLLSPSPPFIFLFSWKQKSPKSQLYIIRASTQGTFSLHQRRREMKASLTAFYASDWDIDALQLSQVM